MRPLFITRELDYALRILRDLSDGQQHVMKELCERECVPHKFAYKIVRKLADAEFIYTVRGVGGGVKLRKPLDQITIYQLLCVMDPNRHISACTAPDHHCEWVAKGNYCHMHTHLLRIENIILTELDRNSLQDLLFSDTVPESAPAE